MDRESTGWFLPYETILLDYAVMSSHSHLGFLSNNHLEILDNRIGVRTQVCLQGNSCRITFWVLLLSGEVIQASYEQNRDHLPIWETIGMNIAGKPRDDPHNSVYSYRSPERKSQLCVLRQVGGPSISGVRVPFSEIWTGERVRAD